MLNYKHVFHAYNLVFILFYICHSPALNVHLTHISSLDSESQVGLVAMETDSEPCVSILTLTLTLVTVSHVWPF